MYYQKAGTFDTNIHNEYNLLHILLSCSDFTPTVGSDEIRCLILHVIYVMMVIQLFGNVRIFFPVELLSTKEHRSRDDAIYIPLQH